MSLVGTVATRVGQCVIFGDLGRWNQGFRREGPFFQTVGYEQEKSPYENTSVYKISWDCHGGFLLTQGD